MGTTRMGVMLTVVLAAAVLPAAGADELTASGFQNVLYSPELKVLSAK